MLKKSTPEIPAVAMDKPGFKGMSARFALTRDDGMPHYALRIMEFEPGGHTSLHAHAEEHEFYFVEGAAAIVDGEGRETPMNPGDIAYIAPHEAHQLKNIGAGAMRVVCTIPILEGGDGKMTTGQSGGKY